MEFPASDDMCGQGKASCPGSAMEFPASDDMCGQGKARVPWECDGDSSSV